MFAAVNDLSLAALVVESVPTSYSVEITLLEVLSH